MSRFRAPALIILFFFFNDTATTEIYTLSLHDALPIWQRPRPRGEEVHGRGEAGTRFGRPRPDQDRARQARGEGRRSEEHTSELQSPCNLVCRLLLEKKKKETYCDDIRMI